MTVFAVSALGASLIFAAVIGLLYGAYILSRNSRDREKEDARLRAEAAASGASTKVCPECRSKVDVEARRCAHCRYRFV